jgi:hypothetical protein
LFDSIEDLRWRGPGPTFATLAARLDAAVVQPSPPGVPASAPAPRSAAD